MTSRGQSQADQARTRQKKPAKAQEAKFARLFFAVLGSGAFARPATLRSRTQRALIPPLPPIRITSPTTDMLSSVASRFVKKASQSAITRRKLHLSRKASSAIPVFSSATLAVEDAQLASSAAYKAARAKFSVPASKESIEKTKKALEKHGHLVTVVPNKASALSTLQKLIPDKSSVNMAGSTSLVRDLMSVLAAAVRRPILRATTAKKTLLFFFLLLLLNPF